MKTEQRKIPKLLGEARSWSIDIDLGQGGGRIQIVYTNENLARSDYNRYKTLSAYQGHWITGISYNEHAKE